MPVFVGPSTAFTRESAIIREAVVSKKAIVLRMWHRSARPTRRNACGPSLPFETIHSYRNEMQTNWWLGITRDLALLGIESAEVMWRRSAKLARCDRAAATEFRLMVSEKAEAVFDLQRRALIGGVRASRQAAVRSALNHVRRKVRANRSRLRRQAST